MFECDLTDVAHMTNEYCAQECLSLLGGRKVKTNFVVGERARNSRDLIEDDARMGMGK